MNREEQVINSFSQIADGLLSQYSSDIKAITAIKGDRPSFEELMISLKQLEKELTGKAVKLIDMYKREIGDMPDTLESSIRQAIADAIHQFVKTL